MRNPWSPTGAGNAGAPKNSQGSGFEGANSKSVPDNQAALAEIVRRGAAIINGTRLVGGPRAVAFDLASVAAKALGATLPSTDSVQATRQPPQKREPRQRGAR